MCLKMEDDRWPSLWCHSDEVVLTTEKESKGDELVFGVGHSYTPSLVQPCKRIAVVRKYFTKNEISKNSIEVLFEW